MKGLMRQVAAMCAITELTLDEQNGKIAPIESEDAWWDEVGRRTPEIIKRMEAEAAAMPDDDDDEDDE